MFLPAKNCNKCGSLLEISALFNIAEYQPCKKCGQSSHKKIWTDYNLYREEDGQGAFVYVMENGSTNRVVHWYNDRTQALDNYVAMYCVMMQVDTTFDELYAADKIDFVNRKHPVSGFVVMYAEIEMD